MKRRATPWNAPIGWLLGNGQAVSAGIAAQMTHGLYTSMPIFLGGVFNSIAVATAAAWRHPSGLFMAWLALEVALGLIRLPLIAHGRRARAEGRQPAEGLTALMACAWAASVGFGTFLCIVSGDWVIAAIACLSATGMVCGICLRNFGTPRLAAAMVILTLSPCAVAGLMTREPIMAMISVQLPVFMFVIMSSAFALNRMMVARMVALEDLARSESFNKSILESGPDYTLVLDRDRKVVFCSQPDKDDPYQLLGRDWLSLVPEQDRPAGVVALAAVEAGGTGNLTTCYPQPDGSTLWFDVAVQKIADDSGRLLVVARDISHQKRSEENALWLARHDPLTALPNRSVLQDTLDAVLTERKDVRYGARLSADVDNFKAINDTMGHDGGDALLCAFAERLVRAASAEALVARTGGDEFALLVPARTGPELHALAARIFAEMAEPFAFGSSMIESGASIGAAIIRKDGKSRAEIFKAADIALYAAKADGRARMKIFEPAMKLEVDRRQAMMTAARRALQRDLIVPHYQPKVLLGSAEISGFEALLRWQDASGAIQGPQSLEAALDDPNLGPRLSARMLDHILDDIALWREAGVPFGHVALNLTSADFRAAGFVTSLLARLRARQIPPECLQIEVTESVFLGRTADAVENALGALNRSGIRIALDDFGTGYASLSHLRRFPVDVLKIDRAFVQDIGRGAEVEAISAAVINLGHCMGMEVVAEGVETREQELYLSQLGCDMGQGFLYSCAVPADEVTALLKPGEAAAGRLRSA